MTFRLLQVCNVGRITGGTAACAWTVTRALPSTRHTVAFLQPPSHETLHAFAECRLLHWPKVTARLVGSVRPDLILLHNTARKHCDGVLPAVTVQYLHSQITPASADLTLYCSSWLAAQCDASSGAVCLQAVPRPIPLRESIASRTLRATPVVGRICTPTAKKWPRDLPATYARLAQQFPQVRWEFIGAPSELVPELLAACGPETGLHAPSWEARRHVWSWDALLYHNPGVTESFGRTTAEAMRAGCIPIVDDRGGFREQITAGTGFLCSSVTDFADAIQAILDPGERFRRSRACRAHADQQFSLARFARDLLDHFTQATSARAARVR